jgi:hypothetical protein
MKCCSLGASPFFTTQAAVPTASWLDRELPMSTYHIMKWQYALFEIRQCFYATLLALIAYAHAYKFTDPQGDKKHVGKARQPVRLGRQRRGCPGNPRVARCAVRRHRSRGPANVPTSCSKQLIDHARQAGIDSAVLGQHRLRQHHPGRPGRALPGQHRDRGAPARLHALERDGDGGQGQPPAPRRRRRPGRPHLELRLAGDDVRHRLQPLLARRERRTTAATCCTSRATRRRASTRAPSWKAASPKSSC